MPEPWSTVPRTVFGRPAGAVSLQPWLLCIHRFVINPSGVMWLDSLSLDVSFLCVSWKVNAVIAQSSSECPLELEAQFLPFKGIHYEPRDS